MEFILSLNDKFAFEKQICMDTKHIEPLNFKRYWDINIHLMTKGETFDSMPWWKFTKIDIQLFFKTSTAKNVYTDQVTFVTNSFFVLGSRNINFPRGSASTNKQVYFACKFYRGTEIYVSIIECGFASYYDLHQSGADIKLNFPCFNKKKWSESSLFVLLFYLI